MPTVCLDSIFQDDVYRRQLKKLECEKAELLEELRSERIQSLISAAKILGLQQEVSDSILFI